MTGVSESGCSPDDFIQLLTTLRGMQDRVNKCVHPLGPQTLADLDATLELSKHCSRRLMTYVLLFEGKTGPELKERWDPALKACWLKWHSESGNPP